MADLAAAAYEELRIEPEKFNRGEVSFGSEVSRELEEAYEPVPGTDGMILVPKDHKRDWRRDLPLDAAERVARIRKIRSRVRRQTTVAKAYFSLGS